MPTLCQGNNAPLRYIVNFLHVIYNGSGPSPKCGARFGHTYPMLFLQRNFCQILTYTKDFSWKKWPKFTKFRRFYFFKSPNFNELLVGSQEYTNFYFYLFIYFGLPSYLICSQIWLNYFLDDCHFGYVTKSLKETLHSLRCHTSKIIHLGHKNREDYLNW